MPLELGVEVQLLSNSKQQQEMQNCPIRVSNTTLGAEKDCWRENWFKRFVFQPKLGDTPILRKQQWFCQTIFNRFVSQAFNNLILIQWQSNPHLSLGKIATELKLVDFIFILGFYFQV